MHSIISQQLEALTNSRWRHLPLTLAVTGILGGLACAMPVTIATIPASDNQAHTLLRPATAGNPVKQYQLALAYRYGIGGVDKDLGKSWSWIIKSTQHHYEPALVDQADGSLIGLYGRDTNLNEGLSLWRDLAANGSMDAPAWFALRLVDVLCPCFDPREAAKWFEAAARRGHRYAAFKLAQQLEHGEGVQKNLIEAYAWYSVGRASEDVDRLRAMMRPAELELAQARTARLQREMPR